MGLDAIRNLVGDSDAIALASARRGPLFSCLLDDRDMTSRVFAGDKPATSGPWRLYASVGQHQVKVNDAVGLDHQVPLGPLVKRRGLCQ